MGGVAWDYGQYAEGLRLLGHDVYYVEDSGEWPYNTDGGPSGDDYVARDCDANIRHLADTMLRFRMQDRWSYRFPLTGAWYGMSDSKRTAVINSADALINVSGTLEHPGEYRRIPRLAYIDSDPVFTQIKILNERAERGSAMRSADTGSGIDARVEAHDVHFSFGEVLSATELSTGHRWRPTRQPIVLSHWRPESPAGNSFTTVMNWTSYRPVVYKGETFGQKDGEFVRFLPLAMQVRPALMEVAMPATQHSAWQAASDENAPTSIEVAKVTTPHELLKARGWSAVDSAIRCGDPESYRDYIEGSRAEWSVAKNGYVAKPSGWFSCRSACYLAAGRPVVVQDTGFPAVLPVGEGLFAFRELDEAVDAVREVNGNYQRHARAARELAEYFDSGTVLTRLLDHVMGSPVEDIVGAAR